MKAHTVPVLMYHHVAPQQGFINCTPANFEDQLRWLKNNGYTSLTTEQFAGHLAGKSVPKRSVLITFDDGYLDNWVYASPLLQKYGFNAVLFIVTGWIGDGKIRENMNSANLPDTPTHSQCTQLAQAGEYDKFILRWSEIQQMQEQGVFEFHSHTHTHTRWDKGDQAGNKNDLMRSELEQSKQCLQDNLGSVSKHFCWPQGYFDNEYINIAVQAGFEYLYTTQAFGQNKSGSDPLNIYRFAVRNTTGASVGRRIQVASNPIVAPVFNGWKKWKRSLRK